MLLTSTWLNTFFSSRQTKLLENILVKM